MPLLDISANVPRLDSPTRKRSHEDFVEGQCQNSTPTKVVLPADLDPAQSVEETSPTETSMHISTSPPAQSSPASLTDSGSTPAMGSPSPNKTPSQPRTFQQSTLPVIHSPLSSQLAPPSSTTDAAPPSSAPANAPSTAPAPTGGEPPAKRKRLTAEEKEEKAKADEQRKQEREQAKAAKLAERAKAEEEKKAKLEERNKKLKEKEEENKKRAEEKEKKQREREEKQREKEEEARKAQEAKEKKERSQLKLASFFKAGPSTPSKKPAGSQPTATESPLKTAASAGSTPQKPAALGDDISEYRKIFKPFFVKEHVTLARNAFEMDDAAKDLKSKVLDEFVSGERHLEAASLSRETCADYFKLPSLPRPRGRIYPSVRKIMTMIAEASGGSLSAPIDLTGPANNSQGAQTRKTAGELMREVPMKYICYTQDVRPAYYGTITTLPRSGSMRKLARCPISRELLPLQYDYDSEAEWVDDGDGEDIDDADDDEEEVDEDEDMTDFLDDSEDNGVKRPFFASGIEPESSGICFETETRPDHTHPMSKYRMEFIPKLDQHESIDPFSTKYWEMESKPPTAPNSLPLPPTSNPGATMPPPPPHGATSAASGGPASAFAALALGSSGAAAVKKTALVPPESMNDLKHAILRYANLSKVGLIEVLSKEFSGCTKPQIRNSIEAVAERWGPGRDKEWRIKPEHAFQ